MVLPALAALFVTTLLVPPPDGQALSGTTGSLAGVVEDASGAVLPKVTVAISSPAIMGVRTTVTGAHGRYLVQGLPPGEYSLSFTLEG